MSWNLEKFNTLWAVVVTLVVLVVFNGFLYYRYPQVSDKLAGSPMKPADTLSMEPAGALHPRCSASEVDLLGYSDVLDGESYERTKVGALSGLSYDSSRNVYYALSDSGVGSTPARFYTLKAPIDKWGRLTEPLILDVAVLRDSQGKPFTGANLDGEGIAVTREGEVLIASEVEPSILRFSLDGRFLGELPVPQKFLVAPKGYAKGNASFESLELSPNDRNLFTANEQPLSVTDGKGNDQDSSAEHGWVHLLRYKNLGSSEFEPSKEFLYPIEQEESVSEIAALSENDLLILETQKRRIFRVALDEAGAGPEEGGLAASGAIPLEKKLVVDVDDSCPMMSAREDWGHLEGMALGSRLPGGRRVLLLQSDDDFGDAKSRMVMLSIPSR